MKHLLLTTIAAVVLVGCGESEPLDISIHNAVIEGDIQAVKQHLAAGADVNAKDGNEWTPLHYAAANGHKEIAELLITKGANVNAKDDDGGTPNAKDEDGGTPLDGVISRKHPKIADLLRKHGGKTGEELKAEGK